MNFLKHHLALKNWLEWPLAEIPKNWSFGTKGQIVLLPGFASTWNFLKSLGNALNSQGYQVHVIKNLDMNVYSVSYCLSEIKKYLHEKNLDKVFLLGHSKGGLIACLSLSDNFLKERVSKVITIATPFNGNFRAYRFRWFFNLRELIPGSEILRAVNQISLSNRKKIINLYARIDHLIYPESSKLLPGAKNLEVDVIGHTQILESNKTISILRELLK